MTHLFYFWLATALCFLLLEVGHPGLLLFISFSFGAVVAAITSIFTPSLMMQCTLFLLSSIAALFVLKRWITGHARAYHAHHKTNVYALQGKQGVALTGLSPDASGTVKLGGETWSARVAHDHAIAAGDTVRVVSVSGSHVRVEKIP